MSEHFISSFTKILWNKHKRGAKNVSSPDASFGMTGWSSSQTLAEVCLWAFKERPRPHGYAKVYCEIAFEKT